jgi:hypothetical protein
VNKPAKNPLMPALLSLDLLEKMDVYWRAANLTVGQIYLQDNPLLETALKIEHIKSRLRSPRWATVGECSAKCLRAPSNGHRAILIRRTAFSFFAVQLERPGRTNFDGLSMR